MSRRIDPSRRTRWVALAALAAAVVWLFGCSSPGAQVAPITDVQVTSVAGGVLVEWTGGTGATGFAILRSQEDAPLEQIAGVPGDRTSYADYTVEQGGKYRYAVAALGPGVTPEPVEQASEEPVTPLEGVMLSLVLDGGGTVIVDGAAAPVSCDADCVVGFEQGAQAVLTAVGDGLSFAGFSSPCPPTATCALTMTVDRQVTALFRSHVLRLTLEGGAATRIYNVQPPDDRGVDECVVEDGNDCILGYTYSGGPTLKVSLNAQVAQSGGKFIGFAGACDEPQGSFCVVNVEGATEVVVRAAVPPKAVADEYRVPQVGIVSVDAPGVLANDTAVPDAKAELVSFDAPGTLNLAPDGSFTYESNGINLLPVSFTYRVVGPLGLASEPAEVTLNFVPRPVANADGYSTDEDQPMTVGAPGVRANDNPPVGTTVELVNPPAVGSLDLDEDGSFTYSPAKDMNGSVTFTYRLAGEFGMESEPATVAIDVQSVNDPPSFTLSQTEVFTTVLGGANLPGFATAISPGGEPYEANQTVSFTVTRQPGGVNPNFIVAPAINTEGTLVYQAGVQAGTWTYLVVARDSEPGDNTSEAQTFTITVGSGGGGGGGGDGGGGGPEGDDD